MPLSFILFFVLFFFLIGEQLVALPIYFIGPGLGESGPDKLHILDLHLSDAVHRPIAYVVIGSLIWVLFRVFAWPLAWILGAFLWALEQSFLTPLDQRPSISNIIFFTFTFWIALTLVPYFIYRAIDRKWGKKGKRNAILFVLIINLLLLVFFAYQIFYLQNSYRGLVNQQAVSSDSISRLPLNTCPDRLIVEKDKQTVAYWNGTTLSVGEKEQKWIEENCPGVLRSLIREPLSS